MSQSFIVYYRFETREELQSLSKKRFLQSLMRAKAISFAFFR